MLDKQRWDNAVYLAGYVVECGFKVLVEVYIPEGKTAVKKYGHDLTDFSFKGGVGRTTALVATALTLARNGQRVAIVDLDLEAPGLSTMFSRIYFN